MPSVMHWSEDSQNVNWNQPHTFYSQISRLSHTQHLKFRSSGNSLRADETKLWLVPSAKFGFFHFRLCLTSQ